MDLSSLSLLPLSRAGVSWTGSILSYVGWTGQLTPVEM